ncbi:MAG: hypothetical protein K5888_06105 [Lachnospiraceae bacterium]|nr:hypothetical protein [Lachnospiraceae bacterium]
MCIVIFKFFNKDKKVKTKYDEMQERQRGRAYMFSFWTLVGLETVMCLLQLAEVKFFMDPFTSNITCIIIAALVHACYSVEHDAYIGLNTNSKRFMVVCIAIGIVNAVCGIIPIAAGGLVKDGVLQAPFANLLVAIVFIIIGVQIYIKNRTEKEEED